MEQIPWIEIVSIFTAGMTTMFGAIGPALQSVGISAGYYLFAAAPYALTLAVMFITCRPNQTLSGAPGELSLTR